MSASEFFDCGPEPSWLVDACEGEIASPNFGLEFSLQTEASSSTPFLELNHSAEAGPSYSAMELDEVTLPNDLSFAHNPGQENFIRFVQDVHFGDRSVRPPVAVPLEQQSSWLNRVTTNVPNRVPTRRLPPPSSEQFFRACKKRKRSCA